MDYKFKENGTLNGVDCDVKACKYHSESCCCSANKISIESRSAVKKGETFCSTFTPRCE